MTTEPHDEAEAGPPPGAGRLLVDASWVGTAVYVLAALVGTVWLDAVAVTVAVSIVLFALGTVAFLWAYARAVNRSRYDAIGMGGLFFLAGSAPARVRWSMTASFAVQVVVAFVTASVRIYTPVAFGLLVPMYGLGLMGLWGATFGTFPPRRTEGG